jgi:hypothetical protein
MEQVAGQIFEVADAHAAMTAMAFPDPLGFEVVSAIGLDFVAVEPSLRKVLFRRLGGRHNRWRHFRPGKLPIDSSDLAAELRKLALEVDIRHLFARVAEKKSRSQEVKKPRNQEDDS